MASITLESADLRDVILGLTPTRMCPRCNGSGQAAWLHYCLRERPHDELDRPMTPQGASDFSPDDYPDFSWCEVEFDECDACSAVGHISHLWTHQS
jgi:hypothetical protein